MNNKEQRNLFQDNVPFFTAWKLKKTKFSVSFNSKFY